MGVEAASERVAERFTRPMRAATSPYGVLTDPPVVCAVIAGVVLISVILFNLAVIRQPQLWLVYVAIVVPVAASVAVNVLLFRARAQTVAWLSALPFVVDNINGLLNGVAAHLVVRFSGTPPTRTQLSELLEALHPDCFPLEFHPDEPEIELVIGVPESKLNPAGANHRRFLRARRMIDDVLVGVHAEHAIASVRIA